MPRPSSCVGLGVNLQGKLISKKKVYKHAAWERTATGFLFSENRSLPSILNLYIYVYTLTFLAI